MRWLPGTHTLLVLARGSLLRLDADASPPAVLQSVQVASEHAACMTLMPSGDAAVLLLCQPYDENTAAQLQFFDLRSLRRLDEPASWILPLERAGVQPTAVHASFLCVVACFGTTVWLWRFTEEPWSGELKECFSHVAGLAMSPCGLFLAFVQVEGERDEPKVVLMIETRACSIVFAVEGISLPQLPNFEPMPPLSVAWSGPDGRQLHVGSQGPPMYEDSVAYRVFSV